MGAQVPMGKATPIVLDALTIEYFNPKKPEDAMNIIPEAWQIAEAEGPQLAYS